MKRERERAEYHLHKSGGQGKEREEKRVLRGVVGSVRYITKSRGPRTEPWGTPQEEV